MNYVTRETRLALHLSGQEQRRAYANRLKWRQVAEALAPRREHRNDNATGEEQPKAQEPKRVPPRNRQERRAEQRRSRKKGR